jgi:hypothetical protein
VLFGSLPDCHGTGGLLLVLSPATLLERVCFDIQPSKSEKPDWPIANRAFIKKSPDYVELVTALNDSDWLPPQQYVHSGIIQKRALSDRLVCLPGYEGLCCRSGRSSQSLAQNPFPVVPSKIPCSTLYGIC